MRGHRAFYDFAGAGVDSLPIDIVSCRSATVLFNPDEDGTATGAEIKIHICDDDLGTATQANHLANSCTKFMIDTDNATSSGGENDVSLDGSDTPNRSWRAGITGSWLVIEVTANPSTADDARVTLTCH